MGASNFAFGFARLLNTYTHLLTRNGQGRGLRCSTRASPPPAFPAPPHYTTPHARTAPTPRCARSCTTTTHHCIQHGTACRARTPPPEGRCACCICGVSRRTELPFLRHVCMVAIHTGCRCWRDGRAPQTSASSHHTTWLPHGTRHCATKTSVFISKSKTRAARHHAPRFSPARTAHPFCCLPYRHAIKA